MPCILTYKKEVIDEADSILKNQISKDFYKGQKSRNRKISRDTIKEKKSKTPENPGTEKKQ